MTEPRSSEMTLLTVKELATYLGVPRSTLYGWKYRGDGPPAIRVGRLLRYRSYEVERWLDAQTRNGG
jgi:excisionase family DNA binding protein